MNEFPRKVAIKGYPAQYGSDKGKGDTIAWLISPPYPVLAGICDPLLLEDPDHAFLRPFNLYFDEGNPNVGQVTYLGLHHEAGDVRALCSACLTPGSPASSSENLQLSPNRLLIYPAVGVGIMSYAKADGKVLKSEHEERVDHFTIEQTKNSKYRLHVTTTDTHSEKKKRKPYPSS